MGSAPAKNPQQIAKPEKLYDILKDFDGVNHGVRRHFYAGEQSVALCADLAAVTVRKGWAREVKPCAS